MTLQQTKILVQGRTFLPRNLLLARGDVSPIKAGGKSHHYDGATTSSKPPDDPCRALSQMEFVAVTMKMNVGPSLAAAAAAAGCTHSSVV